MLEIKIEYYLNNPVHATTLNHQPPLQAKALHNLLLKLGVISLTYNGTSTLGWNLSSAALKILK